MTTYGITPAGWVPKTLSQILAEIQADLQATFGAGINLAASSVFGQLANRLAQREADIWSLGQSIWAAFDPLSASDASLDNLCALAGVIRLPASYTTVVAVLVGTNGTVVPISTVFSAGGLGKVDTDAQCTIATVGAWVAGESIKQYDLRLNDSGKIYVATVGGTTAGSGGPVGTATAITDNSVTWRYVATATSAVVQACTALVTGAQSVLAGTLTTIETPVGGLSSVVNPLDATIGRNLESDAALRLRREQLLRQPSNAALEAIRARLLLVTNVTSAAVLQNDTDTDNTGTGGQPPHAVECLVLGGLDADVRAAVFASKAAGTRAYGSTTGTVVDSQGISQEIDFSRPTTLAIYVTVNGTKDASTYPSAGDALIKQALVNYSLGLLNDSAGHQIFAGYKPGDTVNAWNLVQAVQTVSGVKKIASIFIGVAPSPGSSADINTTIRQLAQFDTSRIVINIT